MAAEQSQFSKVSKKQLFFIAEKLIDAGFPTDNPYNDYDEHFKELENINPSMKLLGFRLNNRVYSKKQVEKLKKLSYLENISGFHNSLKVFTKIPYYKFKSKKLTSLSK